MKKLRTMIKFFRQLRQKLVAEGKSATYFKYAIGEIVLVVIGILIALQLNNWNELRKRRNLEIEIYKELYRDIDLTREEVENDRNAHISLLQCVDSLLTHLTEKRSYDPVIVDRLLCSVADLQVYPKTSGFDALKSIGLDLLTNDSIRSQLTDLYQLELERVVKQGKEYTQTSSLQQIMNPYLNTYLTIDASRKTPREVIAEKDSTITFFTYEQTIRDYDKMIEDTKFFSLLNRVQWIRRDKVRRHYYLRRRLEKAMVAIEEEINRLQPK